MRHSQAIDHDTPEFSREIDLAVTRPRRAAPAEASRVTRAEVNLSHARHNLHELRACIGARSGSPARIWAVLKADGYGHGAAQLAVTLEQAGVDGVCVALLEEGIDLRNAGVRVPILIMSGAYGRRRDGLEALVHHGLTPVVYSAEQLEGLANAHRYLASLAARGTGAPVAERLALHVKIDTGMGRLGVREPELGSLLTTLRSLPELRLEGLMTHLACADAESDAVTTEQLARFESATETVRHHGFSVELRHAANSAATLRWRSAHYDIVRPGLALFGVHPCATRPHDLERAPKLKPVMRVLSEVVALRELPVGASVGYGHDWTATRPSRIATIPMGYADGLSRALSNRGSVLLGGARAPIVGTVSMDMTMIDVTDIPNATVRDEVVVLGEQRGRFGSDCITAAEFAEKSGTVSWECLTSISRRVPRFYRHS
ncbi:MAG: alanine racemase [Myxococcales bacterium]|nr:alanine racemase [Myxococcales bacterium]